MDLSDRKRNILKAIIENYILSAEPIGSKMLAGQFDRPISSATIRNEMSELEEMGYLEKPHVSAGRVPSYAAYRLYVDELMDRYRIAENELARLRDEMQSKMREMDNILVCASQIVSKITNHTAVSMLSHKQQSSIKRIELISVDDGFTYAAVIITDNAVRHRLLKLQTPVAVNEAALLATSLNVSVKENSLDYLLATLARSVGEDSMIYILAEHVVSFVHDVEREDGSGSIYVDGMVRLLTNREYRDIEKARDVLEYLSDKNKMSELAKADSPDIIQVKIGPENGDPLLNDASFMFASYQLDENTTGVIGVVAPTRMDYARTRARLQAFVQSMSQVNQEIRNIGEADGKQRKE